MTRHPTNPPLHRNQKSERHPKTFIVARIAFKTISYHQENMKKEKKKKKILIKIVTQNKRRLNNFVRLVRIRVLRMALEVSYLMRRAKFAANRAI